MKKPLVIVGNSEIARIATEYFVHDSSHAIQAYATERDYVGDGRFLDRHVLALEDLPASFPPGEVDVFVAVGSGKLNRIRTRLVQRIRDLGYSLTSYVSSRAFVWHNVQIGENCFILEDNTLQPFVKIGNNVTLWSGNHIGHGSIIEDHVFIASHVVISGLCRIGESSFMGVNSATAEEVVIARDNFIAMGAAVTKSTQPDQVLMGVPAAPHRVTATRFCRAGDA
ncbi:MAG: acetyltransferase [Pseudomonadota bacterium]|nr:acetyltransferase [Pseudomonadota bacterium]